MGYRAYWEVEYAGWVVVGATYEGAGRRNTDGPSGLGENEKSWGLGWAGKCYHAWHKGLNVKIVNNPQSSVIGVYLDQPAGVMSFYAVREGKEGEESAERKEVTLLHRVKCSFKDKMLPGVWLGTHSSCSIVKKDTSS